MQTSEKLSYLLWAATSATKDDNECPNCKSSTTEVVRRKYLFTSLRECTNCGLRYRTPTDRAVDTHHYYQEQYSFGFTTDCPQDEDLNKLLETHFRQSEKDFTQYLEVVHAAGVPASGSLLDYGSSWGYGSWQFTQAGYKTSSFEISVPRANFAKQNLGCTILEDLSGTVGAYDCVFSAHVIEHMTDPSTFWNAARQLLKPRGLAIVVVPNGDPDAESFPNYDRLWGKVHPLMLTARSLRYISDSHGFESRVYSNPYDLNAISDQADHNGPLIGSELLLLARLP